MPNTLVHFAVQVPATRALGGPGLLPWAMLGCVVPDLPWILQRVVGMVGAPVDAYDLRAYVTVQASLLFCLLLAAAGASLARRPLAVFVVLAANSAAHLLLDALEIKWGNGVNLLSPFDWRLWSLGLVWPEHWLVGLATFAGAVLAGAWAWRVRPTPGTRPGSVRWLGAALLLAVYALAPLALLGPVKAADAHYIATLADIEHRAGRPIELDRVGYSRDDGSATVTTAYGETFTLVGELPVAPATVSIRGRFLDAGTILAEEVRVNDGLFRNAASALGLAVLALVWLRCLAGTCERARRSMNTDA